MNFSAFDLNLLRVFDALMRERSATRAGEQVGLSQPAVSAALNRLRDILDDKLFVRQGNDMVPTSRAENLAPGIRNALASLEVLLEGDDKFDPAKISRMFTILAADAFSTLLIPDLVSRMQRSAPGVALRIVDLELNEALHQLEEGTLDMALGVLPPTDEWLEKQLIFTSPFKIVIAKSHPVARELDPSSPMSFDAMSKIEWALRATDGSLHGIIDDVLAAHGKSRKVVVANPHFHGVMSAVANGGLAAAVPVQFAKAYGERYDLLLFDLPFEMPAPDIFLYWHSRHTRNSAQKWMRGELIQLTQRFALKN